MQQEESKLNIILISRLIITNGPFN